MPSPNERFGVRRGVTRGTLYRYFESSVPVPTYAKPRPTAKPQGVSRHPYSVAAFDRLAARNIKGGNTKIMQRVGRKLKVSKMGKTNWI